MSLPNSRILLLLFFIFSKSPFASSLSFNIPSFSQDNYSSLIRPQGNVSLTSDGALSLTTDDRIHQIQYSAGRAVYKDKLLLWNSKTRNLTNFSSHFTFSINNLNNSNAGDGLTFFLLSNSSLGLNESIGGSLGLYANNKPLYRYLAVEIDTFKNFFDQISSDHAGINIDTRVSAANVSLNSSFKDGRPVNVSVDYDAVTHNFTVFISFDNNSVSLWHVVDLREILPAEVDIGFSASTGASAETHEILSWDFTSDLMETEPNPSNSKIGLIVGLSVAVVGIIVVSGVIWFIMWRKKAGRQAMQDESMDDVFENERGPKKFTFDELLAATNYFSTERKLGQGGFGEVYRGLLNNEEVAIKKVSAESKQGKKEYASEVRIISRLRHRNLVQLVGWCHKQSELLLVYKLMPNGSLDTHLYNQDRFLSWPVRYKIVLGLASALFYLHEEWEQCVVHRDIKPSNVMLDSEFEAKLGDFGLARLVDHEIGSQTTVLAGTMGYLAPESVTTGGRARKESDVYSFGIVALEIACGRKPVEFGKENLVNWAWEVYGKGLMLEAADQRLEKDFDEKEMQQLMVVGLWCAHPDHNLRPSIQQAISVLKFESRLPNLPPTMPVSVFFVPPMNILYTSSLEGSTNSIASGSSTNSMYTGYTTNSSSLNSGSQSKASTYLLKSHKLRDI